MIIVRSDISVHLLKMSKYEKCIEDRMGKESIYTPVSLYDLLIIYTPVSLYDLLVIYTPVSLYDLLVILLDIRLVCEMGGSYSIGSYIS
jgi:hypothetical protein